MSAEPTLTIVGNLTDDPDLRFTSAGVAVANFTVANSPRILDRETGQWRDGDTLFLRCTGWRQTAENIAEGLHKGTRVVVTGKLRQRSYDSREGDKRSVIELEVDEIGASLRYATTATTKRTTDGAAAVGTNS